jgi:8-oxo-dGTP pyrophosphatase MutT (NUDIX family)
VIEEYVPMQDDSPTKYVVGLAFSGQRDRVVLIKKKRGPEALIGKWNGVGGHVEPGEAPQMAMSREFLEEAGVATPPSIWEHFLTLRGQDWVVYFYHVVDDQVASAARTTEDELVGAFYVLGLPSNLARNLRWIIPMALGHRDDHVLQYEVLEAKTIA